MHHMTIDEQYHDLPLLDKRFNTYIGRDGVAERREETVLIEHLMDVFVNGKLTMKLICLPQYLAELVLGRLLTEGIIDTEDDVDQIYVCEYGRWAAVTLNRSVKEEKSSDAADYVEVTPTCCTGNRVLNDYFVTKAEVRPVNPIPWTASQVFGLSDRFHEGMPLHSQTWATHSCYLSRGGSLLFQCEDIGRHNALDKVIGYALRNGIPLRECIAYSSGRIPTDMVMKAIHAGIPVLCSKASPTAEAIELAKEYDLTLVCAARSDRMKVFAGRPPEESMDRR